MWAIEAEVYAFGERRVDPADEVPQVGRVEVAHVAEARAVGSRGVRSGEGGFVREVDVVGDQDRRSDRPFGPHVPGAVRDDGQLAASGSCRTDTVNDSGRFVTFVAVDASEEHENVKAAPFE